MSSERSVRDYETFFRALHQRFDGMRRSSKKIAAPICLAQALITGLAARVQGNRVTPRIPPATSDD